MTPFLSKIQGNFDGLFGIFFGKDGITIGNQAFDLGLTKKYKWAGDGAIAESTNLPALGDKIEGFVGINRYIPVFEGALRHAVSPSLLRRRRRAAEKNRSVRTAADRYVQSNFEAMNALKVGMQKSKFEGRKDTMKLIEALEGLQMKLRATTSSQGDKLSCAKMTIRHSPLEVVFEIKGGKHSHHRDDCR